MAKRKVSVSLEEKENENKIYHPIWEDLPATVRFEKGDIEKAASNNSPFNVRRKILKDLQEKFGRDRNVGVWFDRFHYYMKVPYLDGIANNLTIQQQVSKMVG